MNLCTCVSEEEGDGESAGSEALSLLFTRFDSVSKNSLLRVIFSFFPLTGSEGRV